jgi:hypothetical protein
MSHSANERGFRLRVQVVLEEHAAEGARERVDNAVGIALGVAVDDLYDLVE